MPIPNITPIINTAVPSAASVAQSPVPEPIETGYIGNQNSKKFHRPDCRTLPAKENRVPIATLEEALEGGYSPCKNCMPNWED